MPRHVSSRGSKEVCQKQVQRRHQPVLREYLFPLRPSPQICGLLVVTDRSFVQTGSFTRPLHSYRHRLHLFLAKGKLRPHFYQNKC